MPVPILPVIGGALSTASALLGQRSQRKALEQQQAGLGEQYDLAKRMLEYTRPEKATLTQSDLIRKQRAMQDPLADQLRREEARRNATSVGALTAAGPRALQMLNQVQTSSADRLASIGGESERRTQDILGNIAGREQNLQQYNLTQDQRFREAEAGLEMDALQNRQNVEGQLAGLRGAGWTAALSGLAGIAGSMPYDSLGNFTLPRRNTSGQVVDYAAGANPSDEPLPDYNDENPFYGKKGMRIPGKFSHKENPVDLVQDGKKVGEATGNEVILNPEQIEAVKKESKYLRKLLKTKRFK